MSRYDKKTLPQLKAIAQRKFNKFIRERDMNDGFFRCISCGEFKTVDQLNAGHYYNVGHYEILRFNENNCWGQCVGCNCHKHGNLIEYRKGLVNKIGEDGVKELDTIAEQGKRMSKVFDRHDLIEIIKKY